MQCIPFHPILLPNFQHIHEIINGFMNILKSTKDVSFDMLSWAARPTFGSLNGVFAWLI